MQTELYPWLQDTFSQLIRRYYSQRLHHALLFQAEKGTGAVHLSLHLASALLCQSEGTHKPCGECKACHLINADSHPDLHMVESDKPSIGVDLIRELIEKMQKTSQLGTNKLVLIPEFERLTEAASNAFLKTLEEPTANTYILLNTQSMDALLPTILSRCEQHSLALPSYTQSAAYITSLAMPAPSKETLAAYAHSPLIYLQSQGQEHLSYQQFSQQLRHYLQAHNHDFNDLESYKDASLQFMDWFYHFLKAVLNQGNLSPTLGVELHLWIEQKLLPARKSMKHQGINKVLAMRSVLDNFKTRFAGVI